MKTSEFIKKVEELGYTTMGDVGVEIYPGSSHMLMAYVSNAIGFSMSTYKDISPELFDLVVEYARTPLEDRKDEEKYRLHLPLMKDSGYVNTTDGVEYFLSTKHYVKGYQTVFTASKIAELEKKFNLDSFEREEVIEDETRSSE